MTKKVFSKAIAVVLVAAMCMVAVFTGVVSAVETRTATCTVVGAGYYQGTKESYVTADVTFTSTTAFTAGSFEVSTEGLLSLVDCTVKSKTVSSGSMDPNVYLNVSNNKVLFAGFNEDALDNIATYTSLTLTLQFTVNNFKSLDEAPENEQWTVGVASIDLTNTAEEPYTTANASGIIHIHKFTYTTSGNVSTATCSVSGCGESHTKVTNTSGISANTLDSVSGYNVTFSQTGDTVLNALVDKETVDNGGYNNVYFIYTYITNDSLGVNSTQTATTSLSAATVVYDENNVAYYAFPCGRNSGIGRLHCKVKGNFVTVKNGNYTISGDWEHSIREYAAYVVTNGDPSDVNWAKALVNYGYWTASRLAPDEAAVNAINDAYGTSGAAPYASLANPDLPSNKKAAVDGSDTWSVAGVTVTTGYKPKMKIRLTTTGLNPTDFITIKVDNTVRNPLGKTVYYKEIAVSNLENDSYTISDIPTKYLENDIVIGVKKGSTDSPKTVAYSYGRYAKARQTEFNEVDDKFVFRALFNWIYYIGNRYNP